MDRVMLEAFSDEMTKMAAVDREIIERVFQKMSRRPRKKMPVEMPIFRTRAKQRYSASGHAIYPQSEQYGRRRW